MAPKPPPSDDQKPAAADDPVAPELDEKLVGKRAGGASATGRGVGDKAAAPSPRSEEEDDDDDDEEPDDEDEDDEDDDEDLVVFTAREAAGALATVYAFVKPFLRNYKKILALVGLGVLVETLFNVIMPLSLKFLIDDALGEEDFEALVRI